jgi:hypothetical protein
LGDLRLVVRWIDSDQQIARFDVLEIIHRDGAYLTRNAAGEPCRLSANLRIVGGLHGRSADPGVPAQRRQSNKQQCSEYRQQRDGEAAPRIAGTRLGFRSRCSDSPRPRRAPSFLPDKMPISASQRKRVNSFALRDAREFAHIIRRR